MHKLEVSTDMQLYLVRLASCFQHAAAESIQIQALRVNHILGRDEQIVTAPQ